MLSLHFLAISLPFHVYLSLLLLKCAMSQAVSHQPYAAEAQIQFLVCPCRTCGGQIDTERGFPQNIFIFPRQYHSTNLHIHLKHVTLIRKTNNAFLKFIGPCIVLIVE